MIWLRVKIGQTMEVTMDSYKGKVFEATVDKIYPIMDERSRTFNDWSSFYQSAKAVVSKPYGRSQYHYSNQKNVLTIPKSYLVDNEYVLVNEDEKRKVKIGLNDYQNVEILSGLAADETIYKPK